MVPASALDLWFTRICRSRLVGARACVCLLARDVVLWWLFAAGLPAEVLLGPGFTPLTSPSLQGFNAMMARYALAMSRGDLEQAINSILSGQIYEEGDIDEGCAVLSCCVRWLGPALLRLACCVLR